MKHSVLVNNKKYDYELSSEIDEGEHVTRVICKSANLNQTFLNEDVPALLLDLPNLILDELDFKTSQKSTYIRVRVTPSEKIKIQKRSIAKGYKNTSEFIRSMAVA